MLRSVMGWSKKQNWPLCCQRPSSRDWRQANRLRDRASIRAMACSGTEGPSSCGYCTRRHWRRGTSRSRLSLPVAARAIRRSSGSWASSSAPMRTLLMMAMLASRAAPPPDPVHRGRVALPVMGKIGAAQIDAGVQGVAVEKHDLLHEASCHWFGHDAKHGGRLTSVWHRANGPIAPERRQAALPRRDSDPAQVGQPALDAPGVSSRSIRA